MNADTIDPTGHLHSLLLNALYPEDNRNRSENYQHPEVGRQAIVSAPVHDLPQGIYP